MSAARHSMLSTKKVPTVSNQCRRQSAQAARREYVAHKMIMIDTETVLGRQKELSLPKPLVKLSQGSAYLRGLMLQRLPGIGCHAIGARTEVSNEGDAHSNDAADTRPETSVEGVVEDLPCFFWGQRARKLSGWSTTIAVCSTLLREQCIDGLTRHSGHCQVTTRCKKCRHPQFAKCHTRDVAIGIAVWGCVWIACEQVSWVLHEATHESAAFISPQCGCPLCSFSHFFQRRHHHQPQLQRVHRA